MATDDQRAAPEPPPSLVGTEERLRNASQRDTRAGFDIYRSTGGTIPVDELNVRLRQAGYKQVSLRSYAHFRSLVQAGYTRYVSINRFDIARAAEPYENASGNGRYSYRPTDLAVSAIFTKASRAVEASGRSVEIGDVGTLISFTAPAAVTAVRGLKPQAGGSVSLRYTDTGHTVAARIVEADVQATAATVEVEFTCLASIAALGAATALPLVEVELALAGEAPAAPQTLDGLNRQLYHALELVEGLRALVNRAGESLPTPAYAAPPLVRHLAAGTPPVLRVAVAAEVDGLLPRDLAASVMGAACTLATQRAAWHDAARATEPGHTDPGCTDPVHTDPVHTDPVRADGEDAADRAPLVELQVAQRRLQLALEHGESELATVILRRAGQAFPGSGLTRAEAATLVAEHVLPPLRALGRLGVTALPPDLTSARGAS